VATGEGGGGEGSATRAIFVPIISQIGYGRGTEGWSVDIWQSLIGVGKAANRRAVEGYTAELYESPG